MIYDYQRYDMHLFVYLTTHRNILRLTIFNIVIIVLVLCLTNVTLIVLVIVVLALRLVDVTLAATYVVGLIGRDNLGRDCFV